MGRGRSPESLRIMEASRQLLEEDNPRSVRGVCYKLFTMDLIPNMKKRQTNKVGELLVVSREQGAIPWSWVTDDTRPLEEALSWEDITQSLEDTAYSYRRNPWQNQPKRVEIWSEKNTISGILAPILRKYVVGFRPLRGYASATVIHDIAEKSTESDKPLMIFYLGDWDPSGMDMSQRDLPERLERYGAELTIKRIALVESDVYGTTLPSFEADTKKSDKRHKWFVENYGPVCWELDALEPQVLRDRVEEAIRSQIDWDAWEQYLELNEADKAEWQQILDDRENRQE